MRGGARMAHVDAGRSHIVVSHFDVGADGRPTAIKNVALARLSRNPAVTTPPASLLRSVAIHACTVRSFAAMGCRGKPSNASAFALLLRSCSPDRRRRVIAAVGEKVGRASLMISERTRDDDRFARRPGGNQTFRTWSGKPGRDRDHNTRPLIERFGAPAFVKMELKAQSPACLPGCRPCVPCRSNICRAHSIMLASASNACARSVPIDTTGRVASRTV